MLKGDGLPYLHHHMQIYKEMEPDIKPLAQPNHAHSSAGSSLVSFLPPQSIHSPPPSPGQHPVPQSSLPALTAPQATSRILGPTLHAATHRPFPCHVQPLYPPISIPTLQTWTRRRPLYPIPDPSIHLTSFHLAHCQPLGPTCLYILFSASIYKRSPHAQTLSQKWKQ